MIMRSFGPLNPSGKALFALFESTPLEALLAAGAEAPETYGGLHVSYGQTLDYRDCERII